MSAPVSVLIPAGGDCPHRASSLAWVVAWWGRHFPDFQVVVEADDRVPFNKSRVANRARRRASGRVLILADGDVFLPPSQVRAAVRLAEKGEWGWAWSHCPRLNRGSSQRIKEGPPITDASLSGVPDKTTGAAAGGLVVVPASMWDAVRGMDERFEGWGGEDNAFALSLARTHGEGFRLNGPLWHLWHPRTDATTSDSNLALYHRYRAARTRSAIHTLIQEKP